MREGLLRAGRRATGVALTLVAAACSTDTSGLARREPGEATGGASGAAAAGGGAGGGAGSGSTGGTGTDTPVLSGTGAFTVVHGVVDGGALFVCLSDRQSGTSIASDAAQPSEGLPYGGTLELPTSWDLGATDVEVTLFVAAASMWAGSSCAELAAAAIDPLASTEAPDAEIGDAGPVPAPFPLEPAVPRRSGSARFSPGALRPGARYALIVAGCTSPGITEQTAACGEPDALFGGRVGLVVAEISSELVAGPERVGLQFVNASRAVERADLTLQSETQQPSAPLGNDVPFGAVRPLQAADVAAPIGVELHVQRESSPSYVQAWSETLSADPSAAAVLGHNHLLAYVGPLPSANVPGLAPPRFVLIQGR
jgi:hypothetical protein